VGRIVNAAWGPTNISAGASVYQHAVTTSGTLRIQPFLDSVVGGANDYIAWVQKQRGGAGASYLILPTTTGTGIAGYTEIAFASISLDCVAGDVIDVYVDGQPADIAVSGKIEIFRDPTIDEIEAAVCGCVTSSILGFSSVKKILQQGDDPLYMYRGDTWTQQITGLGDLTGNADIWFGIKDDKDDIDAVATVLISRTVGLEIINGTAATVPANGSIAVVGAPTGGIITVTLAAVETAKLTASKTYFWDVQKDIGGTITTPKCGKIIVSADIVRATS